MREHPKVLSLPLQFWKRTVHPGVALVSPELSFFEVEAMDIYKYVSTLPHSNPLISTKAVFQR